MTERIAERIRQDRRPEGEMFDLVGQAGRLRRSLGVVEEWIEVAFRGEETGHLTSTAERMRDQLEEDLARTAWRMHVLDRRREIRELGVEDPKGAAAGVLSDALLHVYCVLRQIPDDEFGGEVPERERYAHMGALLAAQEAANAEMERAAGERPA